MIFKQTCRCGASIEIDEEWSIDHNNNRREQPPEQTAFQRGRLDMWLSDHDQCRAPQPVDSADDSMQRIRFSERQAWNWLQESARLFVDGGREIHIRRVASNRIEVSYVDETEYVTLRGIGDTLIEALLITKSMKSK